MLQVVREVLPSGEASLRVNIDATAKGNLARFFNHRCASVPNSYPVFGCPIGPSSVPHLTATVVASVACPEVLPVDFTCCCLVQL